MHNSKNIIKCLGSHVVWLKLKRDYDVGRKINVRSAWIYEKGSIYFTLHHSVMKRCNDCYIPNKAHVHEQTLGKN